MGSPAGDSEAADRLRGIGLFCAALLVFTFIDTSAKYAVAFVPSLEIVWARYFFHALLVVLILRPWRDWTPYRTRRPFAQTIRAMLLFLSTIFNFLALRSLRLDQTTTISFSAAFVMAAMSGPLLGDWVGPRRWAAIVAGFIGVLIVIRPGTTSFEPAMLLSVGSMLSYSAYMLYTRHLAGTDTNASMILIAGALPALLLTPVVVPVFVPPPTIWVAGALLLTGIAGAAGHWLLIQAHRLAPTSVLSPFLYTELIWMISAGYIVFDEVPDRYTIVGAVIIVASGLYILYRQRVHGDT